MSNTVESKVVEMKFDNKDFEANVKTSMSTLDKLKEKLNFKSAGEGLSNIKKASDSIDFSGMQNGLEVASVKFSALQVAGMTAINNITTSLMGLAQNLVQTFAIEPKTTGFDEYELKMGSIQTIMASTGASLDEVNGYLDELNVYADKTIYSFSDMTENIGKFTNAGVDLKSAVKAIQGVSNEAAVSGANANEASRAMYNFAQALSAGYVKLIDWKSIENANMATVEFKNELLKTAVALGTVVEADGMYISTTTDANGHVSDAFDATRNFNDSLSAQWMTTEVLTQTLGRYADETTDIGKKAFASAQDVKTFSMMMDTLKESAGSGWTTTWELIFGDFEQAKVFWTDLTNSFDSIIQTMANARNNFVAAVMGGGDSFGEVKSRIEDAGISLDQFQSTLIEVGNQQGIAVEEIIASAGSMENAFKSGQLSGQLIIDTLKAIADQSEVATDAQVDYTSKLEEFQKVVDDVWYGTYYNGEERIQALTEAGYDYAEVQDLVNKTVDGHRLTLEDLNVEQLKSVGYTQEEIDALQSLAAEAEASGSSLNTLINDMTKLSGREMFTKSITNTVAALTNVFNTIREAWSSIFKQEDGVAAVRSVLETVYNLSNKFLTWSTAKSEELSRVLKGVFSVIKLISDTIGGAFKFALQTLGKLISGTDTHILDMAASVGDAMVAFTEWVRSNEALNKSIEVIQKGVNWFVDRLLDLKKAVTDFIKNFGKFDSVTDGFNKAKESLKGLSVNTDGYKQILSKVSSALMTVKEKLLSVVDGNKFLTAAVELVSKAWEELLDKASKWFDFINDLLTNSEPLKNLAENSKAALEALSDAFTKAGEAAANGSMTVAQACNNMRQNMIQGFADAFNIGSINDVFAGGLSLIQDVRTRFSETFTGIQKDAENATDGIGSAITNINWSPLIAILGSAGILYTLNKATKALQTFANTLKSFTQINDAVAGFIKQGTATLKAFDKVLAGVKFKAYADGIRSIAISIAILAASLFLIGTMDVESLKQAGIALAGITAALAALMAVSGFGKVELNTQVFAALAAMFVALAAVFLAMSYAMKTLSGLSFDQMLTAIGGLGAIVAALAALTVVLGKTLKGGIAAKQFMGYAVMVIALAAAAKLMADALKSFGEIDSGVMEQGLHTVGTLAVYLAALTALTYKANPATLSSVGAMALSLSAALILVIAAIKLAGNMKATELEQGLVVVGVLGAFLAAIISVITKQGSAFIKLGGTIIGISVAIGILVAVAKMAGNLSEDEFQKGAKAIGVFGAMCAAMMIAVSRLGGEKGAARASVSILAMSVALGALVAVCYLCSLLDDESLNRGLRAVAVLGSIVALMTYSLKGAQEANKSIIAMVAVIAALVIAVSWLGMMDQDALVRGTAAMSALMVCFGVMMQALRIIEKENFGTTLGTLVVMMAVVTALAGVLYAMGALEVQNAMPNAIALSDLMLSFAASMAVMASIKKPLTVSRSSIAVMLLVVTGLAAVLGFMSSMEIQNGISNAIALSTLLLALSASCVILGTIKTISPMAIAAMAALTVICAALGGILVLMTALNVQDAIQNALAISELVLALSAACVLLSVAGSFGPAGIAGVGILAALIVAVGGLMLAIGELNNYIPDMQTCINSAIPTLSAIGEGLGEMVGNFVGGTLESFSSHLPGIATNLSEFIANLDPFLAKIESIGGMDLSGVQQLAGAILALSAAELLQGMSDIVGFFTGNDLTSTLNDYADAIKSFCDKAVEFNVEGAQKAALVAPMIAQLMESMPEEGGLKATIFGSKSDTISFLKDNLGSFADAVASFAEKMAGVDTSNVENGVEAGKKIAELMATDMPTTGGLAGMVFGDQNNTMQSLQTNLSPFADAIVDFASKTAGIDTSGVDPAVSAIRSIASALSDETIQNGFNFYVDTESIKNRFNGLGEAAANFANSTAGVDYESVSMAVNSLHTIASFINTDLAEFNGDNVLAFVTSVNQLAEVNVAALVAAFQNGAGQMTEAGFNLMTALASGIQSGGYQVTSAGTQCMSTLGNTMNYTLAAQGLIVANTMKLVAERIISTAMSSFSAAVSRFMQAGSNLMNAFKQGLQSKVADCVSLCMNVSAACLAAIQSAGSNGFYTAGLNMMQGLANGINAGRSAVISAAVNTATAALSAAQNALGEHSPSRITHKFGEYFDQGLINGMVKLQSKVEAAGADVGMAAVNSMKNINFDSDLSAKPTITPVVDSNNVKFLSALETNNDLTLNVKFADLNINNPYQTMQDNLLKAIEKNTEQTKGGGDTFVQNNYSPKALSNADIYRQTRNQLSLAKRRAGV